jgi:SAM-dependent methyltransferase
MNDSINEQDYLSLNRQSWNERVSVHLNSSFYDVPGFVAGATSLNEIELELFARFQPLKGAKVLHLQCHFGQDSLSMARMGAKVTGVDLSDEAIKAALDLNEQLKLDARFICCNLYDLPQHLDQSEQFDLVFSSYGTIGWLPDLQPWAAIIESYLKPTGKFIIVEFHPIVWMFDNDLQSVQYHYANKEPIQESSTGTYADPTSTIELHYICWNHSLSEVIQALIDHKIGIRYCQEYDYSPYNIFSNSVETAPNQYQVAHLKGKIPYVFALVGEKE